MATLYAAAFSPSNPRLYPSLAPTFISFNDLRTGLSLARPGLTQSIVGSGIYSFEYFPTFPIYFLLDGITTSSTDRYVYGVLDPVQQVDIPISAISATLVGVAAIATSLLAQGNSLGAQGNSNAAAITGFDAKLGSTASSFGSSVTDPGDLFGYMKRVQEFLEGNQQFNKVSGTWNIRSRGGSLLTTKTLTQSSSLVTRG